MTEVCLTGDKEDVLPGLKELSHLVGLANSESGIPVEVRSDSPTIRVQYSNGVGSIEFPKKSHFFRAVGLFTQHLQSGRDFDVTEHPMFETVGAMLDVSRNSVPRVENVKRLLRYLSVMGFDVLMLYTEDTFQIESYAYFGYLRGAYTESELRECDEYANLLGIEIIPCIQTLAHLLPALQWKYAKNIRDTEDTLLVGEKRTYEFIEQLITTVSGRVKSRRIHIGMDEAFQVGLGSYLRRNGYRDRFQILQEHLRTVTAICAKHGLRPMIWSDMFFRFASSNEDYYDNEAAIPESVVRSIPEGLQLVYWDYYHHDVDSYASMIRKHRALGSNPIFSPSMWSDPSVGTQYGKVFATVVPGMVASKKEGVKEVLATIWKDSGAENNEFSTLLGLQLVAEHAFRESVDDAELNKRFAACTGGSYDDFLQLKYLDEVPGVSEGNYFSSNPSKYLLWQDPMIGMFDQYGKGLREHYAALSKELSACEKRAGGLSDVFSVPAKVAAALAEKADIGFRMVEAYRSSMKTDLKKLADQDLPLLREKVETLRKTHRAAWMELNKPFGWEVLDIRYGGLVSRIETAVHRITEYLQNKIPRIEELEAERLPYAGYFPQRREEEYRGFQEELPCVKVYQRIISPSPI